MDDRRFDALARALGGATSRRGALAALASMGLAIGLPGVGAARKDKDKNRDKAGDDDGGRDNRREDAEAAGTDADAAKRRKRCKLDGKTCRKAKHCCSGVCEKAVKGRRKKGRCACRPQGAPCTEDANCCAVDGLTFSCIAGVCDRAPVATGQVCVAGVDACADPEADCTTYRRPAAQATAQTLCLLTGGARCVKDQDCTSLTCVNGFCAGTTAVVPTGDACDVTGTVCKDPAATCGPYTAGSGGPGGNRCVLPDDEACADRSDCASYVCEQGTCGKKPVNPAEPCSPDVETCDNPLATCTTYLDGDPAGTYCLVGAGMPCAGDTECIGEACVAGTCASGPALVETGNACSTDPAVNRCRDNDAACVPFAANAGGPAGTYCLLPEGQACAANGQCTVNRCNGGVCAIALVPSGDACTVGVSVCQDRPDATCRAYDAGSGGPAGTWCLRRPGNACTDDGQCGSDACVGGVCTGPTVPTGQACTPDGDPCRDAPLASCIPYAPGTGGPAGTWCLVPTGAACSAAGWCVSNDCAAGTCVAPPPPPCDPPCGDGQRCVNGACACDALSCADGCCNGTTCVRYAQQGQNACGTGGAACQDCGATGACTNVGICRPCTVNATGDPAADGAALKALVEDPAGPATIYVGAGAYRAPRLTGQNATLVVARPLILEACGNGPVALDGGFDGVTPSTGKRVLYVNDGVPATLRNITLRNGYTAVGGGGCLRNGGTLTVENVIVTGCRSNLSGGGVFNGNGATMTLAGATVITRNLASGEGNNGGGLHNQLGSPASVVRCSGTGVKICNNVNPTSPDANNCAGAPLDASCAGVCGATPCPDA